MSLRPRRSATRRNRVLEILAEAGRWLLMVSFIGGIGFILVRTISPDAPLNPHCHPERSEGSR